MHCYICAQEGKETPAVAVCLACGMCMCKDHAIREELPVEDILNWGFSQKTVTYPEKLPRFLCKPCHTALMQREK